VLPTKGSSVAVVIVTKSTRVSLGLQFFAKVCVTLNQLILQSFARVWIFSFHNLSQKFVEICSTSHFADVNQILSFVASSTMVSGESVMRLNVTEAIYTAVKVIPYRANDVEP
jgi:urease beta subunit